MMKKKILVLVLVCGLASVANAGLLLSVNGSLDPVDSEITIRIGETVVLDIHGDNPADVGPAQGYLLIEGPGSINGATLVHAGALSYYNDAGAMAEGVGLPAGDADGVVALFQEYLARPALTDVSYSFIGDSPPVDDFVNGLLVDDIIMTCEGLGDVTVTLMDETFAVLDTAVIHQIPEPMTLALLGLGGLFLRRRK